jgi:uncharacterized membrane protein YdfJ with MMPL/SSD domain
VASVIILELDFNPAGEKVASWTKQARAVMRRFTETTPFKFQLYSFVLNAIDTSDTAMKAFPIMVGVTVAVVVFVVSIAFRSVLMPIRLILTLACTVGWTYGFASAIFCIGALNFIPPLHDLTSIYWLVPIFVLPILVGLGVDYDVFLFSRITEYRFAGHTPRSAIRCGFYKTGSVITGAGLVMAVAFSGLMFSTLPVLQQLGFFLSASVLLDTFVIRLLVVPAIIYLFGDANWWPVKPPKPSLNEFGTVSLPILTEKAPLLQ